VHHYNSFHPHSAIGYSTPASQTLIAHSMIHRAKGCMIILCLGQCSSYVIIAWPHQ